jgi:hypothetical protein
MRSTAQILSVDNREYEAAGVALNCFSLLHHAGAALKGPAALPGSVRGEIMVDRIARS